jgi:alpha-N-arabinofuranosidase
VPYRNPVLPGFHPDPTVCRVGRDYYLATSSFEYFPGVPLFHSRDLVHWRPIGHCLARASQLPLRGANHWSGIFAPTLRWHDGRFFMITTNVGGSGHFFVHAEDPAGDWSDPIPVEGEGFDPDLFFDTDGRTWFSRHAHGDRLGIVLREIDLSTGRFVGSEHRIWRGWEDDLCEAPHLYRIGGWYYLFAAEGGTLRSHMVTAGRSREVTGPYEPCPRNPILSHRSRVTEPIQQTGHADLVQAHDGSWWIVFLGIRQPNDLHHHLGRETFLAPVTWEDGWPVVHGGRAVTLEMDVPALPPAPWPEAPARDDFDGSVLAPTWNFRRNPTAGSWSLAERPGSLALFGGAETLDETVLAPVFVGRRQQHFRCAAAAHLEFAPRHDGEEAGLSVFQDEAHHFDLALRRRDGRNAIVLHRRVGDLPVQPVVAPYDGGRVVLRIEADENRYRFSFGEDEEHQRPLGESLARYLSTEVAGGFTGTYVALYATGAGRPASVPAFFDWFEYRETP